MAKVPMQHAESMLSSSDTISAVTSTDKMTEVCSVNLSEGTWLVSGYVNVDTTVASKVFGVRIRIAGVNYNFIQDYKNTYGEGYTGLTEIVTSTTEKSASVYVETAPSFSGNFSGTIKAIKIA